VRPTASAYRPRVGGNITDKWSVSAAGVDAIEVTKSLIPPANAILTQRNVGLPLFERRSSSPQLAHQIPADGYLGTWWPGRLSVEDLWRHVPHCQPGYVDSELLALRRLREAKINKNWTAKLFVNNIFESAYYDALYQARAVRAGSAGRAAYLVISARFDRTTNANGMLICCSRGPEQG